MIIEESNSSNLNRNSVFYLPVELCSSFLRGFWFSPFFFLRSFLSIYLNQVRFFMCVNRRKKYAYI
jgi:hypothetical protein